MGAGDARADRAPSSRPRACRRAEIARVLEHRKEDLRIFLALDTLEYLKRGGRISGARAAIGTMLNVKPIIAVENGIVENAERVRSRPKARERTLELLTQAPLERASILHTTNADIEEFVARVHGAVEAGSVRVQSMIVGPSVGPHLGPGCVGGGGALQRGRIGRGARGPPGPVRGAAARRIGRRSRVRQGDVGCAR